MSNFLASIGAGAPCRITVGTSDLVVVDRCRGSLSREEWLHTLIAQAIHRSESMGQQAAPILGSIQPPTPKSDTVAHVLAIGSFDIAVSFPEKLEAFRDVMLEKRFHWDEPNRRWLRTVQPYLNRDDILVEVACKLLIAGIIVKVGDASLHARITSGAYDHEHTRWVNRTEKGFFLISWAKDEDFRTEAMRLPLAFYKKPVVLIRSRYFAEVQDFAEMFDFRFSREADLLIEEALAQRDAMITVQLEAKARVKRPKKKLPVVIGEVVVPDALKD